MFVFSLLVLSLAGHNATGNLPFLRLSLDSPAYPFNEKSQIQPVYQVCLTKLSVLGSKIQIFYLPLRNKSITATDANQ